MFRERRGRRRCGLARRAVRHRPPRRTPAADRTELGLLILVVILSAAAATCTLAAAVASGVILEEGAQMRRLWGLAKRQEEEGVDDGFFFLFEMIEGAGTTDTYLVDNIIGAWVRAGTKIIGGKKLVWSRTYKRQKVVNIKSFRPGPFVRSW